MCEYFSSRLGFSEMPELNLKVTPVFGESHALIHDFLEARIQDEIKVEI